MKYVVQDVTIRIAVSAEHAAVPLDHWDWLSMIDPDGQVVKLLDMRASATEERVLSKEEQSK